MPTSQAPPEVNEPRGPADPSPQTDSPAEETSISGSILGLDTYSEGNLNAGQLPSEPSAPARRIMRNSRWIDYETHELLEMISELEDERRWARLREGMLWAVLVHIVILFAIFLIPRYILKMSPVVETSSIKDHKDFTYLDSPFVKPPKPATPLPQHPLIDKQTMEQMKKLAAPAPPAPQQQQPQVQEQPKPQPAVPPIPPNPQSQSQVEAPRPAPVPARPNFAMGSQNPGDQLREDMQKAMHGNGSEGEDRGSGGLAMHPGAGTGGLQILSDTQGVDFSSWLARWHFITQRTWDPLIPDEVNPPILKQGIVQIRFKVLPNGQVVDMQLEGRSGDTGLDRAAWGAITGSSYPNLPREFHGPYLELRAYFLYNVEPQ